MKAELFPKDPRVIVKRGVKKPSPRALRLLKAASPIRVASSKGLSQSMTCVYHVRYSERAKRMLKAAKKQTQNETILAKQQPM